MKILEQLEAVAVKANLGAVPLAEVREGFDHGCRRLNIPTLSELSPEELEAVALATYYYIILETQQCHEPAAGLAMLVTDEHLRRP